MPFFNQEKGQIKCLEIVQIIVDYRYKNRFFFYKKEKAKKTIKPDSNKLITISNDLYRLLPNQAKLRLYVNGRQKKKTHKKQQHNFLFD